ncbi:MAG: alpha-galactosidase, partial [Acidobacteriaceae bacterium]
ALPLFITCAASGQFQKPGQESPGSLIKTFAGSIPFSFIYHGKPSKDLLASWQKSEASQSLSGGRTLRTITYRDPASHLEVSREITIFPGGHAIEWMLRMHNGGREDSPMLENILPLDADLPIAAGRAATLHYVHGSRKDPDYAPVDQDLSPGSTVQLAHYIMNNGVHDDGYLPFFNLQWPVGGLVGAVGWTGQWMVSAARSADNVALKSGQELTHLKLHAGESIRTPRILLIEWSGTDRLAGQNALRRLLISYYAARVQGRLAMPPVAHTGAYALIFDSIAKKTGQNPLAILPTLTDRDLGGKDGRGFAGPGDALNFVTEKNQLQVIRNLPRVGIEAYWLDAGWMQGLWPGGRGSWVPNKDFAGGLRPLGEAAHRKGLKFLLWFDPEGVDPGSVIAKEHPEWVLHQPGEGKWGGIFRFSDPAAEKWMTDLLASRISDWQVDIFRMDRNTNPLPFWRYADAQDRQGISEIRQILGLYAMWDGLLQRFPRLVIDNANWRDTGPDIEAMHRTLGSLTRSEVTNGGAPNPVEDQAHTAELSMWVPFHANILNGVDPYNFRSTATTGVGIGLDLQSPYIPVTELRKAISELKMLRPYWLGDYYPLTPIDVKQDTWCGWQFNRPDLNAGFAMFFRRPKSTQGSYEANLRSLDAKSSYEVSFAETYDVSSRKVMTGSALAHLHVDIEHAPGSLLVRYHKINPAGPGI